MKKLVSGLVFLALVVGIVLYATGAFSGAQVEPGTAPEPAGLEPPAATATAHPLEFPVWEDAVGTVVARTTVAVSAQVQARVTEVHVEAGGAVAQNQKILALDDSAFTVKKAQAEEGLRQAKAARERAVQAKARAEAVLVQAKKRYDRVKGLLEASAATPEQMEQAEAGFLQAQAGVAEAEAAIAAAQAGIQQAEQVVAEAEVALGHTVIRAPMGGIVSLKAVEEGDLAWPGKTLLEIMDPFDLRLEAQVREGLIGRVVPGGTYEIRIPAVDRTLEGTVAEVCPTADPRSRTFRVRVDFDPQPGSIRAGMFGRLRIPVEPRQVVVVPTAAVHVTGQLASVIVKEGERWVRRMVTLGAVHDDEIEVLSGLAGNETVGLPEAR